MGPQFALRMLPRVDCQKGPYRSFNGAAVCTADVTFNQGVLLGRQKASMGPQFALRMLRLFFVHPETPDELQWGRSLHCGCYAFFLMISS